MNIWMRNMEGEICLVKVRGAARKRLKMILAYPETEEVALGPTRDRIYVFGKGSKDSGDFDADPSLKILCSFSYITFKGF